MNVDPNKRIIDMTCGELQDFIKSLLGGTHTPEPQQNPTLPARRYVYGIGGIAQLFNCSRTSANRIKASGLIDEAIAQYGRIITVDADLALQLMAESKKSKCNQ